MRKVSSQTILQPVHPWPVNPCPGLNTSTTSLWALQKAEVCGILVPHGWLQFLTRVAGGEDKQAEPLPAEGS